MNEFQINQTPMAYLCFALLVFFVGICFAAAWWAGVACALAVFTQISWMAFRERHIQKDTP